ncbi:MAG: hypothetical protein ABIR91_04850 [Candidatus Saccharimonadales bacterium]
MVDDTQIAGQADVKPADVPKRGVKPIMAVKIFAPFQVYYEGDAYSVSAVNDIGPFDILPRHRNFMCMLVQCTIAVQTPDGQKDVKINRALMHVKADRVVVFVDV